MINNRERRRSSQSSLISRLLSREKNTVAVEATSIHRASAASKGSESKPFLTTREALWPLFLVTLIYMLRGVASGFMAAMNKFLQESLKVNKATSALIQVSSALGYLLAAPTLGLFILKRLGYRWTFVAGLSIYGTGALLFWPAGQFRSLPAYCVAIFVMASGSAFIEMGSIPFITITGPPKWSHLRVNLVMALHSLGTLFSILLASFTIFGGDIASKNFSSAKGTQNLMYVYLADGILAFVLAGCFLLSRLPERSDTELARHCQADAVRTGWNAKPLWKETRVWLGAFAFFCYTGSGSSAGAFFVNYAEEVDPRLSTRKATQYMAIAVVLVATGRFFWTATMRWCKPRLIVLLTLTLAILLQIPIPTPIGSSGIWLLVSEAFLRGPVHPTIFSLTLLGLGSNTKTASALLTAADCGGALWTPLMGVMADHVNTRVAMMIPTIALALTWIYPMWVNIRHGKLIDELSSTKSGSMPGASSAHATAAEPEKSDLESQNTPVGGDDTYFAPPPFRASET